MNTTIILVLVLVCISVYLIVQYKSNFEKHLTYHTPRLLSSQRQEYINGAERYTKKASIIIGLFVSFPLMIMFVSLLSQDVSNSLIIFLFIIFIILIECLCTYLMYRFLMKNIKKTATTLRTDE